jgi:pseudouridine kinase
MTKPVVCIGGAFVDELYYVNEPILPATTNMASVQQKAGGVSRNLAHQLALLDVPVELISVFGDDPTGNWLKNICISAGIRLTSSLFADAGSTGKYTGIINHDGSLYTALLTNSSDHLLTPDYLEKQTDLLGSACFLLADTNLSVQSLQWLVDFSNRSGVPLIIEPVSVPPARKLLQVTMKGVFLLTPNEDELPVLCSADAVTTEQQIQELIDQGIQAIWLHKGAEGSVLYAKDNVTQLHALAVDITDCTGAGDGALSGFVLGKYLDYSDEGCLKLAHTLAGEILRVEGAIATHLTREKLIEKAQEYYSL